MSDEDDRVAREELDSVEAQLRAHPGQLFAQRHGDLIRIIEVWQSFSLALSRVLRRFETDEAVATAIMQNVNPDPTERAMLIRSLDQSVIAYVAALGAVIDHTRNLTKEQSTELQADYTARISKLQQELPAALFLAKLRNYVLHYVAAPWGFEYSWNADGMTGQVTLSVAELLRIEWPKSVRTFFESQGDSIQLSLFLQPYLYRMHELLSWLTSSAWDAKSEALAGANALIEKRNLILTGGVSDGSDWHARMAHVQENIARMARGEPQIDFETGEEFNAGKDEPNHAKS